MHLDTSCDHFHTGFDLFDLFDPEGYPPPKKGVGSLASSDSSISSGVETSPRPQHKFVITNYGADRRG